jgi:hypothetical protein
MVSNMFLPWSDALNTKPLRGKMVSLDEIRPPHQIMAWVGLERYGYLEDAQRLAYRFLYMWVYALRPVADTKMNSADVNFINDLNQ